LDCGSQRQHEFRQSRSSIASSVHNIPLALQVTYPETRISTLQELFNFAHCADPEHKIKMNIESKIDAEFPNRTKGVYEFVIKQHELFVDSHYKGSITVSACLYHYPRMFLQLFHVVSKFRLAYIDRNEGKQLSSSLKLRS
jgi:hypothetical protein